MSKGEDTRDRIIKCANDLFSKNGAHQVAVQEIASAAKVAQPTVYKYFRDKDELLLACILQAASMGREFIDANVDVYASSDKQLFNYISANLIWTDKFRQDASIFFSAQYFAQSSDSIRETLIKIYSQSLDRICIKLTSGEREGLWKIKSIKESAQKIHSLLIGEMLRTLHKLDEKTPQQRAKLVYNMFMSSL
jgi:AcrR family transcriptional regulator